MTGSIVMAALLIPHEEYVLGELFMLFIGIGTMGAPGAGAPLKLLQVHVRGHAFIHMHAHMTLSCITSRTDRQSCKLHCKN